MFKGFLVYKQSYSLYGEMFKKVLILHGTDIKNSCVNC